MATHMAFAKPNLRQQLVSRLREFSLYPSHNSCIWSESRTFRNQAYCQCPARTFIYSTRPQTLSVCPLATAPNVKPKDRPKPNVRPVWPNLIHRMHSGLGISGASVNVLLCVIANCMPNHASITQSINYVPFSFIFHATSPSQTQTYQKGNMEIEKGFKSEDSRSHEKVSGPSGFCIASSAALLFFNFKKEEEDSIELLVAKAASAEKRGQLGDAANFYHQAVTQAQQENKKDKVAFIYDMMANFYLRIDENFKAEKLFKETIKLLLESGFEQTDPAVLEISLKLASMYELQFRYTEAEAGYHFCVSKSEEGLESYKKSGTKDFDKEMNLYAMLGVSLEAYGKFMLKQHRLDEAEKAYLRAIKICENELADKGKPHPQTATLLNDLGTVYEQKKNYSKAMETICKAEELAKDSKDDLAIIMCNKASLHLRNGNREDATSLFRQALRLAERSQDEETIKFVKIAMSKLAAPLRKDS
ncbi:Tetratricopeptide repeat protein 19, mitochondrial [Holothuria leucospilota]|uniref:Tetratricopeptide repeat protein 19, mitochondrial n=1 Tax=Holothuria leucospilota TaxID=206669 RepID=A0A9Q0YSY8_HOLLE|nr:Tetratricopeptide repeat protein 19, mitochondrial [Holothuria leucospilota]